MLWIRIQIQSSKIAIYLSLGIPKREHPALEKMIFMNCFLFFWVPVIFALLDPDPDLIQIWIHSPAENICSETVFCKGNC
jgi:hypothetical protein